MSDIRGMTLDLVERALMEELLRQHLNIVVDLNALAKSALRALVEEDGRFSVPVELIVLGGDEPGSVQSMFDATIGDVLRYAGVEAAKYKRPKLESEDE